ncbi:FirrV-1-B30 precursor [Ectocarpus siliculosus]|uniref:FirrV-1-B30 n=1 Tax=Ectocarpus siliculosus TaxID=2880 RepID=D7FIS5_ECTSI|nr:FirrV-1-B30 precursor [Ectocarpus siliculosus]|eukprot:CBJ28892.1 FirrV-1-B30 precursor [Ectocarpus siliculosus]
MAVTNAGGECIRLRGIYDYREDGDGKNGEGVYVGTSSSQWDNDNNWDDVPDVCMGNIIRDNYIRTRGNEGIDVKEGTVDTLIEYNEVYMQYDDDSGGIGSRGDRSIIRYNYIEDTDGAGVRLGGHTVDGIEYGKNNQVYGNTMVDCRQSAVKVMVDPQGQICDNDVTLPDNVDEDDYEYSGGDFYYDPLKPCDSSPTPEPGSTPTPVTPSPEATPEPTTEPPTTEPPTTEPPTTEPPTTEPPTTEPTPERTPGPTPEPTPESTPETPGTCSDGTEGLDGNGVVCCPLGCGQCAGSGCSTAGAANGLTSSSCCGGGIKSSGNYCDDTGVAPCIYGSAPDAGDDDDGDDDNDDDDDDDVGTCSDGIEGLDGNGVVCCPLGCGQCAGSGCSTAGAANGLTSSSCCGGGIKSSGNYCDDTGVAPCIYGSAPDAGDDDDGDDDNDDDDDDDVGTCSDGIEGLDGNGVVCCPLGCGQCAGSGCSTAGAANGLTSSSCCGGRIKSSGNYCDDTGVAPCIYGSAPNADDDDDGDDEGDDDSEEDDDDENTCSNGLEGIDHKGEVCCPLRCGQCGGSGCSTSGASNGLGADSCCSSEINDSGRHCDDTNEAPCII